jgi:pimeloyl-ACP methyl ester carboxylesterase
MRRIVSWFNSLLKLLGLGLIGALAVTVRYMLKTPQPLDSALAGEARLYKWKHGHIFYSLLGSPSNPPLLLLHAPEIGGSSYEMRTIAEALSEHYRVYAPDLLGFGLSDRPALSYSASTYIDLCRDFLVEVIGQPATLLASGRSCNFAVALDAQSPELGERLVLLSPTSLFEQRPRPDWLVRLLQQSLVATVLYALLTTPFVLRRVSALQQGQNYHQISQQDFAHTFASAHQLGAQHAPIATLAGALDVDVAAQFEHLPQPSLLLWGLRAFHSRPEIAAHHSFSRQTRLILIQDAGAHVQEDRPTEVVAAILSWQREGQPADQAVEPGNDLLSVEVESLEAEAQVVQATPPLAVPATEETAEAAVLEPVSEERAETPLKDATGEQDAEVQQVEAYCMKCKQKRVMVHPQSIVTKNGRRAMEGTCPVCATRLFRFIAA